MRAALWLVDVTGCDEASLVRCRSLLPEEEFARAARFRRTTDRVNFLVGHALLRRALGSLTATHPRDVALPRDEHGRPGTGRTDLDVNLSHTRGAVALVVGRGTRVGVDVERARDDTPRGVERVLLPQERGLDLVTAWTRAEAVLKWAGTGLSTPAGARRLVRTASDTAVYEVSGSQGWCRTLPVGAGLGLSVCLGHPLEWAAQPAVTEPLVPGATVRVWRAAAPATA